MNVNQPQPTEQTKSVELRGAYLQGRREECQEVKAYIAAMIVRYKRIGMTSSVSTLGALQDALLTRKHSPVELPPPPVTAEETREVA